MAIVVVMVAGPAANFSRRSVYQGHYGMVRNSAAFDAMIINHIA